MRIMGKQGINLDNKCACCKNYKPLIKKWNGIETMFARGSCILNVTYKQRTESCKKYIKSEESNEQTKQMR